MITPMLIGNSDKGTPIGGHTKQHPCGQTASANLVKRSVLFPITLCLTTFDDCMIFDHAMSKVTWQNITSYCNSNELLLTA